MSSADEEIVQERISMVLECCVEPMYLSEIARKLDGVIDDMEWSIFRVSQAASVLIEDGRVEAYEVNYEDNGGQKEGSRKYTLSSEGGIEETEEWKPYTIIHNQETDFDDVRDEIEEIVSPMVSVQDKVDIINNLSGVGNEISKDVEKIAKDVFRRQFRNYDEVGWTDYNDSGVDFWVEDEGNRDFGIAIEVSSRYENPVDRPYVKSKTEDAFDRDYDLLVLAPNFTNGVLERREDLSDEGWHNDPEEEMVHVHRVPHDKPEVYRPFAKEPVEDEQSLEEGFPVIISDRDRVQRSVGSGLGDSVSYPVVGSDRDDITDNLRYVEREYRAITESGYRTQLRESIEPMLYEFQRPYTVEQWLIDTYWDKGMTTSEVGNLVGVSGRTIRRWMDDQRWDIVTRGTGTPLSDEKVEIWSRMYEGEEPFDEEMTGYQIRALYNRFPQYDLDDWREWTVLPDNVKQNILSQRSSSRSNITYTIATTEGDRIFPSYSFIISRLRREGVDIREGFFGGDGSIIPTGTALEYMLNTGIDTMTDLNEATNIEVVEMKSSLEVETAEWFSENQIPFGYETFVIPSPFDRRDDTIDSLTDVVENSAGKELDNMWTRIYNKHELNSQGDVGIKEGLRWFDRQFIEPDFMLYPNAEKGEKEPEWMGWDDWEYIIEVGGAYGAGIINSWRDWYRVSGAAYKELALKLLGLWEETYFVIPDSESIPEGVYNDDHYVVTNPTQLDAGLDTLKERLNL